MFVNNFAAKIAQVGTSGQPVNKNHKHPFEVRQRTQEALSQAKRDTLRDKHGMEFEYTDPPFRLRSKTNGLITSSNLNGNTIPTKIEAVWERLPPTNKVETKPIVTQVEGDEAKVWAIIAWDDEGQQTKGQVESYFRLQPSPYTGWDVVQTSLLDDLLA